MPKNVYVPHSGVEYEDLITNNEFIEGKKASQNKGQKTMHCQWGRAHFTPVGKLAGY